MNFLLFDLHIPINFFNFAGSTSLSCFSASFFFAFFGGGGGGGGEPGDGGSAGVVDGCLGDEDEGECSRLGPEDDGGGGER